MSQYFVKLVEKLEFKNKNLIESIYIQNYSKKIVNCVNRKLLESRKFKLIH